MQLVSAGGSRLGGVAARRNLERHDRRPHSRQGGRHRGHQQDASQGGGGGLHSPAAPRQVRQLSQIFSLHQIDTNI